MNAMNTRIAIPLVALILAAAPLLQAGVATSALRETAEWIARKSGRTLSKSAVEETAEALARATAKHGDEALPFLRSTGLDGIRILDRAGVDAPDILRLHARHGDEALWIVSKPEKLAIFIKHGDDAATALMKHPGLADDIIARFGPKGAKALNGLSTSGAQQLAIVNRNTGLFAGTDGDALMDVVVRRGDKAMDFIWRHKGVLAGGTALAVFLANPDPFIDGATKLVTVPAQKLVVDPVVKPIVERTNWTLVILFATALVLLPLIVAAARKASATK